jgi:hypothetical protein
VFFGAAFAGQLPKTGWGMLVVGLICLVGGLAVGTVIGASGGLDPEAVRQAMLRNGSSPPGMSKSIIWFLTAYYALYGYGLFFASIVLSVFLGYWAAEVTKTRTA